MALLSKKIRTLKGADLRRYFREMRIFIIPRILMRGIIHNHSHEIVEKFQIVIDYGLLWCYNSGMRGP